MKQLNEIRTKELRQYPLCRWKKAAEKSFSFAEFLLENCVLKPKEDASKRLQFKMV